MKTTVFKHLSHQLRVLGFFLFYQNILLEVKRNRHPLGLHCFTGETSGCWLIFFVTHLQKAPPPFLKVEGNSRWTRWQTGKESWRANTRGHFFCFLWLHWQKTIRKLPKKQSFNEVDKKKKKMFCVHLTCQFSQTHPMAMSTEKSHLRKRWLSLKRQFWINKTASQLCTSPHFSAGQNWEKYDETMAVMTGNP